jgi:IMP dehydrogenase
VETYLTFSDVRFKPKCSDIKSRSEVDLTSKLGKLTLGLPVISANMADITEVNMACSMYARGGLGILHRFMSVEENVEMYKEAVRVIMADSPTQTLSNKDLGNCVGVSVGVGEDGKERFKTLYDAGARVFCIDVAHGHHINVLEILHWINANYRAEDKEDDLTIIAGNIATKEGAKYLFDGGADVVKCGIGPGGCCQTRENTGVGVPQLSALMEIRYAYPWIPLIADGGIKKTGDIAIALVYADAVMMGGFFAGTSETPGHVYETMDGQFYKTIGGSASAERKVKSGKDNSFVEGGVRQVPFRGHVKYILKKIKENVQSGFSYNGARTLTELRCKAELIKLSGGGKKESKL